MFFHPQTEAEIVSLRNYLDTRKQQEKEDEVDQWIRMVATNRLTGHSVNFFSGYTLPPNQAISAEKQKMLNIKHGKTPGYKNVKSIILKKSGIYCGIYPRKKPAACARQGKRPFS